MIVKSKTGLEVAVHIKQTFAAPREKVFRAWTEPEELKKWWGPAGCTVLLVEVDLRVGGHYRFGIQYPPDDIFYIGGTYREIRPPEKLVFTWRWEKSEMDFGDSLITLEFHDQGDSTEVVLIHEKFPSEDVAERHNQGWTDILKKLANFIERKEG